MLLPYQDGCCDVATASTAVTTHCDPSGTWLSTTAGLSRLRYVNEKLKQDPEAQRAQQGIKACAQDVAHRQNIVSMSEEMFDSAKQEFSMLLQASLNLRQDEIQCVFEWHIDVRRAPP